MLAHNTLSSERGSGMSNTIVTTRYGKVEGKQAEGISVWKGIPYAKPPVGELRFQPPQQLEAWQGVHDATQYGPAAIQTPSEITDFLGNRTGEMSEDCLHLNIWSPKADEKKRPVLVWIHGGAFANGSGTSPGYNGTSFTSEGDIVVVTINYRLGVLGFLHLGELGGKEYASSGNCGILDQIAALQWIKENIEAFGGNPNDITVFGESAGAMSIGILLGMPSAKGLFNKAILQSGAARNILSKEKATHIAKKVIADLEIGTDDISRLKELSAEALLKAAKDIPKMAFGPIIDGITIPEHPEQAISNGSAKDVSILIGTTKDEYRLFTFFDPKWSEVDEEAVKRRLERMLGPTWPKVSNYLLGKELTQTLFEDTMTFDMFTYPAIWLAEQQVKQGAPVWMYRFDWETPILNGGLKSCHALEIPFVWNGINEPDVVDLLGDSPDQSVADQMHKAWIAFARTGNPNTYEVPSWPDYDLEKRSTLIFGGERPVGYDLNKDERLIWK